MRIWFNKNDNLVFSETEDYINNLDFDSFVTIKESSDLESSFDDIYTTRQQKIRDKYISKLLKHYVTSYRFKVKSNKWYKGILFGFSLFLLLVFSFAFAVLLYVNFTDEVNKSTELISICVTFLSLIISVLLVITKYVFPPEEEQYITKIVEIIQNNDLENKRENINNSKKVISRD